MTKQNEYYAQLQAHANVPEDPLIQLDLNYSIQFRIKCPKCKGEHIKKNGPDHNHKLKLQKFHCNDCSIDFYAHTSYVIVQLTVIIIMRILSDLFAGKTPAVQLADRYNIQPSTISRLIHHCNDFVNQVIDQIQTTKQMLVEKTEIGDNLDPTEIIWIDEMFFKVGKQKIALIIAINNEYQVVGWKLSATTNSSDIEDVLQQVDQSTETWSILIGDGNNAYIKALKERRMHYYLIQHIHSKPTWVVSRIHKFSPEKDGSLSHVTVEVNYNVFQNLVKEDQLELGYAIKSSYLPKQKAKKRGRKKGSKNKPKSLVSKKKQPGKRGPKTAKSQGNVFSISQDKGFLDVKWMNYSLQANTLVSEDDKPGEVNNILRDHQAPNIKTIQEMLFVTFAIFQGGAIVSNLIESMNALVRNVIPFHGLKTEDHLLGHTEKLMRIHSKSVNSEIDRPALDKISGELPISPRVGLNNITEFFEVKIEEIEVVVM